MISITRLSSFLVATAMLGLSLGACNRVDRNESQSDSSLSAAGVSVEVAATQSWSGGFNGVVKVSNVSYSAAIKSFEIVFKLNGDAKTSGSAWTGKIGSPDSSGYQIATSPDYLQYAQIGVGQSFEVGFAGQGTFAGATISSIKINGILLSGSQSDGGTDSSDGGTGEVDTLAPEVALTSSSTSVTSAGSIILAASANDNYGVTKVEIFDGTTLLATKTSSPYSVTLSVDASKNGTHSYTAKAYDAAGNSAVSSAVTVVINIKTEDGGGDNTGSEVIYSASGSRLFQNGSEIILYGLNWFGLETDNHVLHGLWTGRQLADFMSDLRSKGFNALRFPLSPESINSGYAIDSGPYSGEDVAAIGGKDGRAALEYSVQKAQEAGMYVLLAFHTCNPKQIGSGLPGSPIGCNGYSLSKWLADLKILANISKKYSNVVGIDITNEPHKLTWSEWADYASQAGQEILAINPNVTVWIEGVGNNSTSGAYPVNWGGNLYEAGAISGIPANRLVYTPHAYGPAVAIMSYFKDSTYPNNMASIWDSHFGHLVDQGYTVIPGEFGGTYRTASADYENDALWQDTFVSYLIEKGMHSSFYWAVNPNSGDTGGIYDNDWKTWNTSKLALLQRLMK